MKFLIFLLLFTHQLLAAPLPPRWRFEYNYGKVNTYYIEKQPSILFTARNIKQVSDRHQFIYQYYLLPPWLDFSLGGTITGLSSVEEPVDTSEQFQYITAFSNIGISIPLSDFWRIRLIAEYFFTTMIVEDDAFGFRNLMGAQVFPEIEWLPFGSDMFFQISPYFTFPIWSDVGGRKETTFGLKLKVPLGSTQNARFPVFAYQTALIIRIFYTEMELKFERAGYIPSEMFVRQIGTSIGFNF